MSLTCHSGPECSWNPAGVYRTSSRGVQPAACGPPVVQDGYDCGPTQNHTLLKTFFFCSSVFTGVCVYNVWPKTTLLPVWPRDAGRLDTPMSGGALCLHFCCSSFRLCLCFGTGAEETPLMLGVMVKATTHLGKDFSVELWGCFSRSLPDNSLCGLLLTKRLVAFAGDQRSLPHWSLVLAGLCTHSSCIRAGRSAMRDVRHRTLGAALLSLGCKLSSGLHPVSLCGLHTAGNTNGALLPSRWQFWPEVTVICTFSLCL